MNLRRSAHTLRYFSPQSLRCVEINVTRVRWRVRVLPMWMPTHTYTHSHIENWISDVRLKGICKKFRLQLTGGFNWILGIFLLHSHKTTRTSHNVTQYNSPTFTHMLQAIEHSLKSSTSIFLMYKTRIFATKRVTTTVFRPLQEAASKMFSAKTNQINNWHLCFFHWQQSNRPLSKQFPSRQFNAAKWPLLYKCTCVAPLPLQINHH